MSIKPSEGRACAVPTANSVCIGGTKAGGESGLRKGWPGGLAGALLPAPMSALPAAGRRSSVERFTKFGLVPKTVFVQPVGINAEPVGIQLFVPTSTRD